jgi:hypothetical protein
MKRTPPERIAWSVTFEPRLRAVAHALGQIVTAQLVVDLDGPAIGFKVSHYEHEVTRGTEPTAPPLKEIVEQANEPHNALMLIDSRDQLDPVSLRLPDAHRVGKKPDEHYRLVLALKAACEQAGAPYAETIAAANDVSPGVVYRWTAEANRRGIPTPADEQRSAAAAALAGLIRRPRSLADIVEGIEQ